MIRYKAIDIYVGEESLYRGKPVADAVVGHVRDLKIASRCMVVRGVAGCYESGEIATGRLEILSYNMPVLIRVLVPAAEAKRVLDVLDGIVGEGIVAMHNIDVVGYRAKNSFFPRQLLVRDVMTPEPKSVTTDTPLSDAVRLLLGSIFTGLPVIDDKNRAVGLITQGDLIRKGGLPLRLGLLAESDENRRESVMARMRSHRVDQAMTSPAVTVAEDRPLTEAVDLMLSKGVKRLPVIDKDGRLSGMLSRLDVFRTVMRESPDWKAFKAQKLEVGQLRRVSDILRRDSHSVLPETSLDEAIRVIDSSDIQQVAVVDSDGKLLGLITDRDLLRYFKPRQEGIWGLLSKLKHPFEQDACQTKDMRRCLEETTARAVMIAEPVSVGEETSIEEAIGLMTEKGLKCLPVVDSEGRFKGMVSRDSLLRTGFCGNDRKLPDFG